MGSTSSAGRYRQTVIPSSSSVRTCRTRYPRLVQPRVAANWQIWFHGRPSTRRNRARTILNPPEQRGTGRARPAIRPRPTPPCRHRATAENVFLPATVARPDGSTGHRPLGLSHPRRAHLHHRTDRGDDPTTRRAQRRHGPSHEITKAGTSAKDKQAQGTGTAALQPVPPAGSPPAQYARRVSSRLTGVRSRMAMSNHSDQFSM